MSLPPEAQIDYVLNECPTTSMRARSTLALSSGVKNSVVSRFPATTGKTTSAPQFTINVPQDHFMHSEVMLNFQCTFAVTPTNAAVNPLADRTWAFSQGAFFHLIDTISIVINGTTIQKRVAEILPHLLQYEDLASQRMQDLYGTPDVVQSFSSYTNNVNIADNLAPTINQGLDAVVNNSLALAVFSPFAKITDGAYGKYLPRTWYKAKGGHNAGNGGIVELDVDFSIPIPFSIFTNAGADVGISQLRSLVINLGMNKNYAACFSKLSTNSWSNVHMIFRHEPEARVWFHQPADYVVKGLRDSATGKWVPQTLSLASHTHYVGNQTAVIASDATAQMQTSSLVLSAIPRRIYIAARRMRGAEQTANDWANGPICYGGLENIRMSFGGSNAIGSMEPQELYAMSARNGMQLPYALAKQVGFVACYDLAAGDIGIAESRLVGTAANTPFSVHCDVRNLGTTTSTFQLVVIVEYDNFITIHDDRCYGPHSPMLSEDTKDKLLVLGTEQIKTTSQTIGGSFLSSLFKWVPRIAKAVYKHAPGVIETLKGNGMQPNTIGGFGFGFSPAVVPSIGGKGKKGGGIDSSTAATASKTSRLV